jgi:hypothetical protein
MKNDEDKNPAAVSLGNASWAKRSKGKTEKQITAAFKKLSMLAAKKRSLDKAKRSMSRA